MPIQLTYQVAMTQLAELAGPENPPHVQMQAVSKIAAELSPNNPRHADVMRALNPDQPATVAPAVTLVPPGEHPYAALLNDPDLVEDEDGDPDDDPL